MVSALYLLAVLTLSGGGLVLAAALDLRARRRRRYRLDHAHETPAGDRRPIGYANGHRYDHPPGYRALHTTGGHW